MIQNLKATKNEAKKAFDAIQGTANPTAVFRIDGEIKTMSATGRKFETMMRDCRRNLIGVYNAACTLEMLQEDLS